MAASNCAGRLEECFQHMSEAETIGTGHLVGLSVERSLAGQTIALVLTTLAPDCIENGPRIHLAFKGCIDIRVGSLQGMLFHRITARDVSAALPISAKAASNCCWSASR